MQFARKRAATTARRLISATHSVSASLVPSAARGRIAAVEPPERARGDHTDKQNAHTNGDDVIGGVEIEVSHPGDEKVGDDEVRKSLKHVHGRG